MEKEPDPVKGLNNSQNASTGKVPTELMYGFKVNEPLSLIGATGLYPQVSDLAQRRDLHCRQAQDAQMFAAIWAKRRYNNKHKKIDLKEGDLVYLRLHRGYDLPGIQNPKLSNQRAGPFKILKKIGTLAYRIEIPRTMRIHPVVSIAHYYAQERGGIFQAEADISEEDSEEEKGSENISHRYIDAEQS